MKKELTKDELKQRQNAGKSHGLYSFRDRGVEALDNDKRSVYIQLREQFKSEPGRLQYREDLAAHIAMMLELGFSTIRAQAEKGYPVWNSPPVARMGTYINAVIRLIDSWPKENKDNQNILDLMNGEDDEAEQNPRD